VVARVGFGDGQGVSVVTASAEIEAPIELVWEVVSDPRNLPHWERHIVRVTGVPKEGLREGTRYVTEMRFMSVRANVKAEVLEWDPPRRATFQLVGLLDATVTTTVEPLGPDRTRLDHVVEYSFRGGPLGSVAARSLQLVGGAGYALRRGIAAQKHQIEDRADGW
jgi:carbon monoxide dehydrogenase subunit G